VNCWADQHQPFVRLRIHVVSRGLDPPPKHRKRPRVRGQPCRDHNLLGMMEPPAGQLSLLHCKRELLLKIINHVLNIIKPICKLAVHPMFHHFTINQPCIHSMG
jgi:hypothetical protein